ncbi:MAG: hypothetical protein IJI45_15795 [Anaerolineaceae bacterium]|nr:hypothetical protein [Anaerolineaceae bacterium]
MSEKMLVTQALDERDLLVKKIGDKIQKIQMVDTKKRNEEKTVNARVTSEEFGSAASAAYQQIMDLIDRYQRIDAAIVASNASTTVNTGFGEYTVAAAIALRNRIKGSGMYADKGTFEEDLATQLERQYQTAVQTADYKNKGLENQAETMRLSILGKDSKTKDTKPLEVVDAYIRENTTEVIDPLESQKKAQALREKIDTLLTELDTQIKVSNATTLIEF